MGPATPVDFPSTQVGPCKHRAAHPMTADRGEHYILLVAKGRHPEDMPIPKLALRFDTLQEAQAAAERFGGTPVEIVQLEKGTITTDETA
jgi:hypothetical protein